MKTFPSSQPRTVLCRQAGLSLVELMIAIAVGLILLAGMTALISRQSSARAELDKSGRQIENGRYALTLLAADIEHAGFYGQYGGTLTVPAALPDPCATDAASIDAGLALPLQGYDAPATVPAPLSGCLDDADHVAGTDILVVRRFEASATLPTVATANEAGRVYVQTTPDAIVTGVGPDPDPAAPMLYTLKQKDVTTPAPLRRYVQHIYFISPCHRYAGGASSCTAAADDGRPVPTLKRLEIGAVGGTTSFVTTPLVEGIENLQFDYGIDPNGGGAAAVPFATDPALAQWPNVMAVQVSILARNTEPSTGYSDAKTYTLGESGSVGPFNDAYKRHVYTGLVRAVNISARKE
jgi:type IV pilus assembly protein PilW